MPGIEHILINPFLAATKRSVRRANALGAYTNAALSAATADPAIAALYAAYKPVWMAWETLFVDKSLKQDKQAGSTAGQKNLFRKLSQDIKEWGLSIENVHRKGTQGYIRLLPNGRRPFRNGQTEQRLTAVSVLASALADEPSLAALHATVVAVLASLEAAKGRAEGNKSLRKGAAITLEQARVDLCVALYGALCGLLHLHARNPHLVRAFFDIATLHRHRHRKVEATVAKNPE